jgi:GH15 family glucan-1,4-alpha-glucosidase
VCEHWNQPDEGIWETRGGRQKFTYGRLMCWVALDRMVRLAQSYGRPADLGRWSEQRDRIYRQIMEQGWNRKRRSFTQHGQTEVLDASLLMMPLVGFVAPRDPMWLSTLDALARSGRLEQARLTFEKMFNYANHLGLYAEEIGLTGEQLGNFPQAFTHLSLINAAISLHRQLDQAMRTR